MFSYYDPLVSDRLEDPSPLSITASYTLAGLDGFVGVTIEVTENVLTIVTVDFDVNDNFVIQGNAESPAGIQGVLFTPTLKEKGRTEEDMGG